MEVEMKNGYVLVAAILMTIAFNLPVSMAEPVVVIPLLSKAKPLGNIITVAKKNGDFTNLRQAINSISDASAENPYLIVIAPGKYQVNATIVMKPYVSITGSGKKTTTLWGNIGSIDARTSAIIRGASNATLSNIKIENKGPASHTTFVTGVINYYNYLDMNHVRVHVFGGSRADYINGVRNMVGSAGGKINDCEIDAIGTDAIGLYLVTGVLVQDSSLLATAYGLYIGSDASGTRVKNTFVRGVDDQRAGTTECRDTYDYDFNDVDC